MLACRPTLKPGAGHQHVTTHAPIRTGIGYDTHGLLGPIPSPGSCTYVHLRDGELGPDPKCTPGAIDAQAVSQSNINSTICRRGGYTSSVRAPEWMTERYKRQVMAAYGIPWSQARNYELDHLVELAAGGSNDTRNLWPEPNHDADKYPRSGFVHNDKDKVEGWTRTAICASRISLTRAQTAFVTDWTSLISTLGIHK